MTRTLDLAETRARTVTLSAEQGRALAASGLVSAVPSAYEADRWTVTPGNKVGVARVGDVEVRIAPKVPLARLLFLVGYADDPKAWRTELVHVDAEKGLVAAVARAFATMVERALRPGLLQGYRVFEETATVLRGRLRETDQLRRHHGLPFPLEIRHDEFTVDIPENRLLLGALKRMAAVPRVDPEVHRELLRLARRFGDVAPPIRGGSAPPWQPNRTNLRLQPALRLAEVIWRATSPEHFAGSVPLTGFLFDMPRVFEGFVTTALRESLVPRYGGHVPANRGRYLDRGSLLRFVPDFLWTLSGTPAAVADAKYKRHRPIQDVYQVLAYCTALNLPRGHLVYARGDADPARHVIRGSPIEIVCHALNLEADPDGLLRQIAGLADDLAGELATQSN